EGYRKAAEHAQMTTAYFVPATAFIISLGTAAILVGGGFEVIGGSTTVGVVVAFSAYLRDAGNNLRQLSNLLGQYLQGVASFDEILTIFEQPTELDASREQRELPACRGEVRFEHVD